MNRLIMAGAVGLALLAMPLASVAQEAHTVHFSAGTTGATIKSSITGNSHIDYRLSANEGQSMDIILTGKASTYFNVLPPGSDAEAIFAGSMSGSEFAGTLPATGTYTIRIYQMGAAASEGKTNKFTLDIGID